MTRTTILLIILSVGICLIECNESYNTRPHRRIVNGVRSAMGEFPYSVDILQIHNKVVFPICGGTIVHDNLILTAAHCIRCKTDRYADVTNLYVVFGSIDLNSGMLNKIIKGKCHPDWDENIAKNDIALLKAAKSFENSLPVSLAFHDDFSKDLSKNCTLVGWGERNPRRKSLKPGKTTAKGYVLKGLYVSCGDNCMQYKVSIPTIPFKSCNEKIEKATKDYKVFTDGSQLCAYRKDHDACQGDSGGPMICDGYQYGIISWGIGCASEVPGVYTRISYFSKWINETMKQLIEDNSLDFIEKTEK